MPIWVERADHDFKGTNYCARCGITGDAPKGTPCRRLVETLADDRRDNRGGRASPGALLHTTAPHGEHTVSLVDDGDGNRHYEILEVEDSRGQKVAFTDEELDSLARWWVERRGLRLLAGMV